MITVTSFSINLLVVQNLSKSFSLGNASKKPRSGHHFANKGILPRYSPCTCTIDSKYPNQSENSIREGKLSRLILTLYSNTHRIDNV